MMDTYIPILTLMVDSYITSFQYFQDILKFGAVFMVVFCAFMVGLHNLYWYYPKDVRKHVELVENNVTTEAEQHFGMYVLGVFLWHHF